MAATRADFLRGGLALAGSAALAGTIALGALGADETDLAWARLGVGTEILGAELYRSALASGRFTGAEAFELRRARAHEHEHLQALRGVLGKDAPSEDDFDVSLPARTLASRTTAAAMGRRLEITFLGAYLGAIAAVVDGDLRSTLGRIAAAQAAHLAFWHGVTGGSTVGRSFPLSLDIDRASAALEPYGA